jgi:transcriptional regulator with XRE-family HTH domain
VSPRRSKKAENEPDDDYGLSDIDRALIAGRIDDVRRIAAEHEKNFGWRVADPPRRWRIWLLTQQQLAEALGISERQIQNLEEKGLPHEGEGHTLVYPWHDALAWFLIYRRKLDERYARKEGIKWLPPTLARAEYLAFLARDALHAARRDELLTESE